MSIFEKIARVNEVGDAVYCDQCTDFWTYIKKKTSRFLDTVSLPFMNEKSYSQLLAKLDAWCAKHEVSQSELARMLGIQRSTVTEWKSGRNGPGGKTTLAILELLKSKPKKPRK
jgi:DNA-binding XRE family transcriptional regulator